MSKSIEGKHNIGNALRQMIARKDNLTDDCKKFMQPFVPLGSKGKGKDGKKAMNRFRRKAWAALDKNGNGHVSLAETDLWLQETLQDFHRKEEGTRLWKLFRPSFIRAFNDAADFGRDNKRIKGTKTATEDDYVQYNEFRLLAGYICIYAAMFDTFNTVDGGSDGTTATDDRRLSLAEWKAAYDSDRFKVSSFLKVSTNATYPEAAQDGVFAEMDDDGKGMVLLIEFCRWIEAGEINAQTAFGNLLKAGEDEVTGRGTKK